jgi:hypothetical protein
LSRLRAFYDTAGLDAHLSNLFRITRSVTHQTADLGKLAVKVDGRQHVAHRHRNEAYSTAGEQGVGNDQECVARRRACTAFRPPATASHPDSTKPRQLAPRVGTSALLPRPEIRPDTRMIIAGDPASARGGLIKLTKKHGVIGASHLPGRALWGQSPEIPQILHPSRD